MALWCLLLVGASPYLTHCHSERIRQLTEKRKNLNLKNILPAKLYFYEGKKI
jgi:hypothetical protein